MSSGVAAKAAPRGWRPRVLVFVGGAAFLVALAFLLRTPVPLFLALPLLVAPFVAALAAPSETGGARLTWQSSGSGAQVTVRGAIRLDPRIPTRNVDLGFGPVEPLQMKSAPEIQRGSETLDFHLEFVAPYPCLVVSSPPELTWRDSFGLLEVPIPLDGESLRIDRFPAEVRRLRRARLEHTSASPGEVRSRTVGRTGEFFAVRAAAPGDAPREINWWATARSGKLLTNAFQLERTGDLVIVLDLRPSPLGPERDAKLLSISRAGAWGIADAFLTEKSRVGVAIFSEFLSAVPLGTGRLQRYRVRQMLMNARLSETAGPTERLAVSLRRFFPPGVTTLLLSPLADESTSLLLTYLRRRGFPTIVLSPSPLPLFRSAPDRETDADRLAIRLLALLRRYRVSEGWRDAPVIDWEDYWSLSPLVQFLASPARWGKKV